MKQTIKILEKSSLFQNTSAEEIEKMLNCLHAKEKKYDKNETVLYAGEPTDKMGLILTGSVHVVKEDYWGNSTILSEITEGGLFGETYGCLSGVPVAVEVRAVKPCVILFLEVGKVLQNCKNGCPYHQKMIENLVTVLAKKNLMLTGKIEHISKRTTREKLLSYLSECSEKAHSPEFDIPFDRQQLADYLSVDRSAMSNELSKLRKEGVLVFRKNHFTLL